MPSLVKLVISLQKEKINLQKEKNMAKLASFNLITSLIYADPVHY